MNSLEIQIAARTIWGEARGEGAAGMNAVAHVLFNRMSDGRWGKTLFDVCLAPYQFSCWLKSDPNRGKMVALDDADPILQQCAAILASIPMEGVPGDPTNGAMWYFTDTIAAPAWSIGATQTAHIGRHIFFCNVK